MKIKKLHGDDQKNFKILMTIMHNEIQKGISLQVKDCIINQLSSQQMSIISIL